MKEGDARELSERGSDEPRNIARAGRLWNDGGGEDTAPALIGEPLSRWDDNPSSQTTLSAGRSHHGSGCFIPYHFGHGIGTGWLGCHDARAHFAHGGRRIALDASREVIDAIQHSSILGGGDLGSVMVFPNALTAWITILHRW